MKRAIPAAAAIWLAATGAAVASPTPASPTPAPTPSGSVSFRVVDVVDTSEVDEDTVIFIDGRQVARFRLDAAHPSGSVDVTVPAADRYDYAMCGRITVLLGDGRHEQRVIDGGATLRDLDGRALQALAADEFSVFYLADLDSANPLPPKDVRHSGACSIPVS